MSPIRITILIGLTVVAVSAAVVKTQGYIPFADAPINYRSQKLNDPVTRLDRDLQSGAVKLRYDKQFGYLPAVLEALHVPVSSQTLVFSKTSFQFNDINPQKPRALYFNDDVYVGRVQGGKYLEFVSFDPTQGAIFYIMDDPQTTEPRFERSQVDCVQCHVAPATRNVPGVMIRSVFTRPSGYQAPGTSAYVNGHDTPYEHRWGGWYVTAKSGPPANMANVLTNTGEKASAAVAELAPTLSHIIDTKPYLTDTSDIVALMVLAHQTQMHNLITEASYLARIAAFKESDKSAYEKVADHLVEYLLFAKEASLSEPVVGSSSFTSDFAASGPRDTRGRSLRDFDLHSRLFKYRCSYLIYSEDFDALPMEVKTYVYHRLFTILTGSDQSPAFASLTPEDRRAILEILTATKPGLPDEWKQFVALAHEGNSKQQKGSI